MHDKNRIFLSHITDILNVEKQILDSVERQTRNDRVKGHGEAYELLIKIETTLSAHSLSLERRLLSIKGGAESFFKRAATNALGALFGVYDRLRLEDAVSNSLRNDYTALGHAAISYTMLYSIARAFDDEQLSDLALQHLTDLTPLIAELSRLIPILVVDELPIEGNIAASVRPEALANTQKAWSREIISSYH